MSATTADKDSWFSDQINKTPIYALIIGLISVTAAFFSLKSDVQKITEWQERNERMTLDVAMLKGWQADNKEVGVNMKLIQADVERVEKDFDEMKDEVKKIGVQLDRLLEFNRSEGNNRQ